MKPTKRQVWFHANCWDGLGAAWAAHRAWEGNFGGDVSEYTPVSYGQDPPPYTPGDEIYILDFSYPRAVLEKLLKETSLTVIDHHKTAMEDLKGLPNCTFDMEHSGAMLTWAHFFGANLPPEVIEYIEDRDLWRFNLTQSQEFNACLRSYPLTFETLDMISQVTDRYLIFAEGKAILRAHDQLVSAMIKNVRYVRLGGHWMPYVNASVLYSEVADKLMTTQRSDCAACYFDRGDGHRQWSLRSCASFDCSEIARQYGGGGHAQAAGFTTDPTFIGE